MYRRQKQGSENKEAQWCIRNRLRESLIFLFTVPGNTRANQTCLPQGNFTRKRGTRNFRSRLRGSLALLPPRPPKKKANWECLLSQNIPSYPSPGPTPYYGGRGISLRTLTFFTAVASRQLENVCVQRLQRLLNVSIWGCRSHFTLRLKSHKDKFGQACNRKFPSCCEPQYESEAKCKKIVLFAYK